MNSPSNQPFSFGDDIQGNLPRGAEAESTRQSPGAAVQLGDQNLIDSVIEESKSNDFHPIDPRYILVERLASFILLVVVSFGSIIACLTMWLSGADQIFIVLAAIGLSLLCLGLLWTTVFWPQIEYRHIHWKLSDVGLEIRRGVFWKTEIAIPWARAQHADVSQGPLQRLYEIGSLTIHTAGTKNSSVTIEGLAHQRAVQLRDEIIRQRKEHDVV